MLNFQMPRTGRIRRAAIEIERRLFDIEPGGKWRDRRRDNHRRRVSSPRACCAACRAAGCESGAISRRADAPVSRPARLRACGVRWSVRASDAGAFHERSASRAGE